MAQVQLSLRLKPAVCLHLEKVSAILLYILITAVCLQFGAGHGSQTLEDAKQWKIEVDMSHPNILFGHHAFKQIGVHMYTDDNENFVDIWQIIDNLQRLEGDF